MILSVDLGHEDVALYLIEKGFPTDIQYQVGYQISIFGHKYPLIFINSSKKTHAVYVLTGNSVIFGQKISAELRVPVVAH